MRLVYFRHPDLCLRVLQSSLDSLGIPRTGSQRVDPGPAVAHRTVALASGVTTRAVRHRVGYDFDVCLSHAASSVLDGDDDEAVADYISINGDDDLAGAPDSVQGRKSRQSSSVSSPPAKLSLAKGPIY